MTTQPSPHDPEAPPITEPVIPPQPPHFPDDTLPTPADLSDPEPRIDADPEDDSGEEYDEGEQEVPDDDT